VPQDAYSPCHKTPTTPRCKWHDDLSPPCPTTGTVFPAPYDEHLANRVREQLAGEEAPSEQAMFGGLAFLLHGNMAVAVSRRGGLLVRLPPQEAAGALARPHTEPTVMAGRLAPGWVFVSAEGVKTTRQLASWVKRGADFARRLPPKAAKKREPPGRR
jgi:hypothetical protein